MSEHPDTSTSSGTRGLFITFEGGEGSGKTTQILMLAHRLRAGGLTVRTVREPGGTVVGEAVRTLLLDPEHDGLDERAELLLYEASRAQHVAEVIAPALAAGEVVLCDRYTDSSTAYQGYGRGISLAEVTALNLVATGGLTPARTILLDIEPEIGVERATAVVVDRLECECTAFHERVRTGFLAIAEEEPERVRVVDASGSVEKVAEKVAAALGDIEQLADALGRQG